MKRIITIILTFTLIFSSLAVSTFAASSTSGKGYVRVKRATYLKYKKAYKDQKKLKIKIRNLQKAIALKQMDYEDAMDQYEIAMEENEKLEGINNWLWMSINSLGLSYNNHIWTVPTEFPSSFMINGSKYTVRRE